MEQILGNILLSLAKASIVLALDGTPSLDINQTLQNTSALHKNGSVFVTIYKEGKLRGCIGSLSAYEPLYANVIRNARAAALEDNRFKPLRQEELKQITLEVAVLTKPKPIRYKDTNDLKNKVLPMHDGIVLEFAGKRATYLPSVWKTLPKFEDFFASLCKKAKLQANCLVQHPNILRYQTIKYQEK